MVALVMAIVNLLNFSHFSGYVMVSNYDFHVENLFIYLMAILISYEVPVQNFCPIFISFVFFLKSLSSGVLYKV